jgi:hypothetical protein
LNSAWIGEGAKPKHLKELSMKLVRIFEVLDFLLLPEMDIE